MKTKDEKTNKELEGKFSDWFYEIKNRKREPSKEIEEAFGIMPKQKTENEPIKKIAKQRPQESEA